MKRKLDGVGWLWLPWVAVLALSVSACRPEASGGEGGAVARPPSERAAGDGSSGSEVKVSLQPDEKLVETLRRVAESGPEGPGLRLNLQGVAPPAEGEFAVRVFFNLADGARPSPEDPGYVGEFAFFPTGAGSPPQSFVLDAAKAVRNLSRLGRFNPSDPVQVTLAPVPLRSEQGPGEFKIKLDEITVTEAKP